MAEKGAGHLQGFVVAVSHQDWGYVAAPALAAPALDYLAAAHAAAACLLY